MVFRCSNMRVSLQETHNLSSLLFGQIYDYISNIQLLAPTIFLSWAPPTLFVDVIREKSHFSFFFLENVLKLRSNIKPLSHENTHFLICLVALYMSVSLSADCTDFRQCQGCFHKRTTGRSKHILAYKCHRHNNRCRWIFQS